MESMNESKNPDIQNKRGWSIVRKAQVIGALVGALWTIMINFIPPGGHEGYPDFVGMLLILTLMPTCKILRVQLNWFTNYKTDGTDIEHLCVAVIINLILGMLVGTFVGYIMKLKKGSRLCLGPPMRCGRSIIYKAAFYGSALSILLAVGTISCGGISGLLLIGLPVHYLCKPFGYDPLIYHDSAMLQCINYIVLPALVNALLFFIIGLLGWFLFSKFKKRPQ